MAVIFSTKLGMPLPLGVLSCDGGFNFSLYAKPAEKVFLQIWKEDKVAFEVELSRTGDIWHIWIASDFDLTYTYSVVYENIRSDLLLDPYARQLDVPTAWGEFSSYIPKAIASKELSKRDFTSCAPLKYPQITKDELVIYEMHIRGFTQDPSSKVQFPGTYLGAIEKIPHLKRLGINAVKLLPVFEFNECEVKLKDPLTGKTLLNYWGYSPVHFFCPMRRYAISDPVKEFRQMVDAFHEAGIEIILDVVYNHTAEGNQEGPTHHFKALAKSSYYLLDESGDFYNYSGCGNSINANHPVTSQLILDSLRYWALEMGVDGFRFDLASLLTRGPNGAPLGFPSLINAIAEDPLLAGIKLFAEPWDAAGLYQVGNFPRWSPNWTEWNGVYRDHVRRFIKGSPGLKGDFATRITGSSDIYGAFSPLSSLNFITAHDGFSLHDLVSYNHKHNLSNGENNADGSSFNDSWNCGIEGHTNDPAIIELRQQQIKNFIIALLVSAGIPMITSGDEYGLTKDGNNNTWCQDNTLNWINWDKMESSPLPAFFEEMIQIRKRFFQKATFYPPEEIIWHGMDLKAPDWNKLDSFIAFEIPSKGIYCFFNASEAPAKFTLPTGSWEPLILSSSSPDAPYSCGIYLLKITPPS